jgi:hypothetical protein
MTAFVTQNDLWFFLMAVSSLLRPTVASLGQCYLTGRGVAVGSVQAYALFAAATDGADNPEQKKGMGERKDQLGKALSPTQLADGERMAAEWKVRGR